LVPGMAGGKLGELDGYVPVATNTEASLAWLKNDLAGALERARREGKLVLVNFTGYACTNCHWMKANMFTRPEIAGALKNFILVDLYTDGNDAPSQANQKLEESRFSTIAIPFYAIFDADQKVVATFPSLTRNPEEYLSFLNTHAPSVGTSAATSAVTSVVTTAAPVNAANSDLDGLALTTLEGTPFDLGPLKGNVVVVNFWATWCVPCRQEIPSFNKMHKELASKGVRILGVSMDDDGAPVVKPFLRQNPMQYTVALGSAKLNDTFRISQLPVTVVFDRTGKTSQRFEGFTAASTIESAIRSVL
ncbi:MAG: redoxin family protein, partial [Acidobacteriota bacterium]|nr:redoxin family protein [Acidobacteriota bacterium]